MKGRTALTLMMLVVTACGGEGSSDATSSAPTTTPPVLTTAAPSGSTSTVALTTSSTTMPAELPPPDPASYTGAARVVNLYVDGSGTTRSIDVWGRRTFTNGPILLAEAVGFAEVSEYFSVPDGYSVDFVATGSGPAGEDIGSLFNPADGQQTTTLFIWDGNGGAASLLFREADPDSPQPIPAAPGAGTGLAILHANQLLAHAEDTFAASFLVGDPDTGTCLAQSTAEGLTDREPLVGGTQPTLHEFPSGTASFVLHGWPAPPGFEPCSATPQHGPLTAEVPDAGRTWVFLYTVDGLASVDALTVPWGTGS